MAKRGKIKLKERDPYKYHRNAYWGLKVGRWTSIFAPFVTLFIIKFDEYFIAVDQNTTVKMSFGVALLMAVAFIAIYRETKTRGTDGRLRATPLSSAIGWGVAFAAAFLLQTILRDLTLILGLAFGGQAGGLVFDLFADNQHFYMLEFKKADIQRSARRAEQIEEKRRQPVE